MRQLLRAVSSGSTLFAILFFHILTDDDDGKFGFNDAIMRVICVKVVYLFTHLK